MLFSKTTGGFYTADIHGENVPADAVEITAVQHAELLHGQTTGKVIVAGEDGNPFLADPASPTEPELLRSEILTLEGEITDRRYREAILGIDNGWLAGQNANIEVLRAKLRSLS